MKITADRLGKRFNREWIFRNLSFTFEPGCYAVVGPNGSGKSTLLQVLWGQIPPSEGKLTFATDDGREIAPEQIHTFLSIATPYMELIEEFTLSEMIAFHFRFKKARDGWSSDQILDYMELRRASGKYISEFSSGMRQRLKLGLAMLSASPLLFLDEPTTNLDQKSTDWYLETLKNIPSATTVLIASNQAHEYPAAAKKIDISTFKQVTTRPEL